MSRNLCSLALVLLTTLFAANAEETPVKLVASRRFEVWVEPLGTAAADVEKAGLFIARAPHQGWEFAGLCQPSMRPDGKRFRRVMMVPEDGVYYFLSRPDGERAPPPAEAKPQFRVVVDTRPPEVALEEPLGHETLRPGEEATIRWQARDDNFGGLPIALHYSIDGGQTWSAIRESAENDGEEKWLVPHDLQGRAALVRVTATDLAGNSACAMTAAALRVLLPAAPVEAKTSAAPEESAPPSAATPPASNGVSPEDGHGKEPASRQARFPEMDANAATAAYHDRRRPTSNRAAYIAWVMAGNLVRQGRIQDSLQYYRTAVEEDAQFDEAWNDAALVYRELGAEHLADSCICRAIEIDPTNPIYHHNRGEILQTQGLRMLQKALDHEERNRARAVIHQAVKCYGKALERAQAEGRLAECAATFFRLGEICYLVNEDPVGARQYWRKVLTLHTPTPDLDNVIHDQNTPLAKQTLETYRGQTQNRLRLTTWQRWARWYLAQLDAMEKRAREQPLEPPPELCIADINPLPPAPEEETPASPSAPCTQPFYGSSPDPGDVRRAIPLTPSAPPAGKSPSQPAAPQRPAVADPFTNQLSSSYVPYERKR